MSDEEMEGTYTDYYSMAGVEAGKGCRFACQLRSKMEKIRRQLNQKKYKLKHLDPRVMFVEHDPYLGVFFDRVGTEWDGVKELSKLLQMSQSDFEHTVLTPSRLRAFRSKLKKEIMAGVEATGWDDTRNYYTMPLVSTALVALSPFYMPDPSLMHLIEYLLDYEDECLAPPSGITGSHLANLCFHMLQLVPQRDSEGLAGQYLRGEKLRPFARRYKSRKKGFPCLRAFERIFGIEKATHDRYLYSVPIYDSRRFYGLGVIFLKKKIKASVFKKKIKGWVSTEILQFFQRVRFARFARFLQSGVIISGNSAQTCVGDYLPELLSAQGCTITDASLDKWHWKMLSEAPLRQSNYNPKRFIRFLKNKSKDLRRWVLERRVERKSGANRKMSREAESSNDKPIVVPSIPWLGQNAPAIETEQIQHEISIAMALAELHIPWAESAENRNDYEKQYGTILFDPLSSKTQGLNKGMLFVEERLRWFRFVQIQDPKFRPHGDLAISACIWHHVVIPIAAKFKIPQEMIPSKRSLNLERDLRRLPDYRDHFIHSFHVFVLGFYLICLIERLKLVDALGFKTADDLLKHWFITAFWHDAGYAMQEMDNLAYNYLLEMVTKPGTNHRSAPKMKDVENLFKVKWPELAKRFLKDKYSSLHKIVWKNNQKIANKMNTALSKGDHGVFSALLCHYYWHGQNNKPRFYNKILMAILQHHIYDRVRWRGMPAQEIDLRQQPLSFMLMLCDVCAEWGRKKMVDNCEPTGLKSIKTDENGKIFEIYLRYARKSKDGLDTIKSDFYNPVSKYLTNDSDIKIMVQATNDVETVPLLQKP